MITEWARNFSARHGIELKYETPLPGSVSGYKYRSSDSPVVVLDSNLPPERQHFALAHEVAHIVLEHQGPIKPEEEAEANHLASEFILPEKQFRQQAWRPLHELKKLFSHASYEVIARRRLAFVPGALTIFDNGRRTTRLTSDDFSAPDEPVEGEWETARESFRRREDVTCENDGLLICATYVDDGRGVERVLLIVEQA